MATGHLRISRIRRGISTPGEFSVCGPCSIPFTPENGLDLRFLWMSPVLPPVGPFLVIFQNSCNLLTGVDPQIRRIETVF